MSVHPILSQIEHPIPVTPLILEHNTLYTLLDRGEFLFHWELYLATSTSHAQTFHITNEAGPAAWVYQSDLIAEMPALRRLLLALQISALAQVPLMLFLTRLREILSFVRGLRWRFW
ncbi:uncharacterized protein N7482_008612 [Penicillium canariense]|uniref:Uncharacterized protein n=1 Tax=Penicillium canariense TaxID=189055 RepID=A0A9W9LIX4_9EURO|nr:uncharacterized protein N7482_008612 [Penicillium canariense]KAJ5157512.1 hypothetical protein N7482_008612 [Penicillium canariense]